MRNVDRHIDGTQRSELPHCIGSDAPGCTHVSDKARYVRRLRVEHRTRGANSASPRSNDPPLGLMELPTFASRTNHGILAMLGEDVLRLDGPAWGGDELLNVVPEPLCEQARSDVGLVSGRRDPNAEQHPISPLAVVSGAERRYGVLSDLGRQ